MKIIGVKAEAGTYLTNNNFIMFPSTNMYYITNNQKDSLKFVQTITYEYINYYWYFSGALTPKFCDEVILMQMHKKELELVGLE